MCGWVEIGPEDADEMVGILAHVDTVPVSDGWNYEPFDGTVGAGRSTDAERTTTRDRLSRRCAMKAVTDSEVPLERRIRRDRSDRKRSVALYEAL